ncbi:MAG: tRNA (guanosine(37)-N1)-methyltransferase TrmD [Clostridia bacterium]|nr:tRNA (guanosine(37)-N1)-methyltransferase TrmD [Clostridia bacterium]MDD4686095.1 tRNA (guanosine(37)-N1)-methyltransferase TrmD [Clostridia bacterium]
MKIDVLTLFPEMFNCIEYSILGRAIKSKIIDINVINFRDFSTDKHKKCDDYPYGGGSGMILSPQPIFDSVNSLKTEKSKVILMSPKGEIFNQQKVKNLSSVEHLIIICGHYEGVDERIIDLCVDEEVSIGDFILTGGEIPALAIIDSISRYIPNVISENSLDEESFSNELLEYPQYTRPQEFQGLKVPEVLISGNHQKVNEWRKEQSLKITKERRNDLYNKYIRKLKND